MVKASATSHDLRVRVRRRVRRVLPLVTPGLAIIHWKKANPEKLEALLAACGHRCCLCRKRFTLSRPYALDHRHLDGLVRGVPCVPCNDKLGFLHDDAGWLGRAADYLTTPPSLAVIGEHYLPGSLGAAKQEL